MGLIFGSYLYLSISFSHVKPKIEVLWNVCVENLLYGSKIKQNCNVIFRKFFYVWDCSSPRTYLGCGWWRRPSHLASSFAYFFPLSDTTDMRFIYCREKGNAQAVQSHAKSRFQFLLLSMGYIISTVIITFTCDSLQTCYKLKTPSDSACSPRQSLRHAD